MRRAFFLVLVVSGLCAQAPTLSVEQIARYHEDGYVLVRSFFDAEEVGLLKRSAKEDHVLDRHSFGRADGEGGVFHSRWRMRAAGLW